MNFWRKLKKEKSAEPILVLAPMADVTDPAFRRIIAKYGKPDVMWTEFVSADGLFLGGRDALIKDLAYDESERPIVAQFFTGSPDMMRKAAALAVELGFDGVDINMGCPDKSVEKQGGGASLMKNPKLAQELILAAKEGVKDAGREIPVSVKTRIGYNKNELETWLPALLDAEPAVITMHARTRKEMSDVPARWEHVRRAVEIRNERREKKLSGDGVGGKGSETLIFGNGDVVDIVDARKKALETGADGVMLGRAIFGNPWLFSEVSQVSKTVLDQLKKSSKTVFDTKPLISEKLRVLIEHTKLFSELLPHKSFAIMKKHFKAYVSGWDGAKELRLRLMDAKNANEVEDVVADYLENPNH